LTKGPVANPYKKMIDSAYATHLNHCKSSRL